MMSVWKTGALSCALCVAGCGSEPTERSGGAAPIDAGVGGGAGGQASGGSGGADAGSKTLFASFVAETAEGSGPALVSFVNETSILMSLWLGQATFVAIPPGKSVGPDLTASAAVEDDTTAGKHESGLCVQFRLKKYLGPPSLAPGKRYSMGVTYDDTNGFVGTLTELSGGPFVALRAEIRDPAQDPFEPSVLTLGLAGERHAAYWSVYDGEKTPYLYAGAGKFTATIDFVDRNGSRFVSADLVELGPAPGYTVVIGDKPVPGAAALVSLSEVSE